jgi:hypothetical protein
VSGILGRFPKSEGNYRNDSRTARRGRADRQCGDRASHRPDCAAVLVGAAEERGDAIAGTFATECIARNVTADPRFGRRDTEIGDLIVDSMPTCTTQVRAMIDAYDLYFGDGEGEAFFMGPYLDVLPTAVSKWVKESSK